MELENSVPFDPSAGELSYFDSFPSQPAVFIIFLQGAAASEAPPYLSRTTDLRRRLVRLLGPRRGALDSSSPVASKRLNLRDVACRIDYQPVGSNFEARWLLYQLNKLYYPGVYRRRLRLKPPALLKVNLRNRFPRCYPVRRISADGSLYYGPFATRVAAERFAAEFLDLFKIRRCVEDLDPDPAHPGCIYSQMRMCLAPCFQGCTDEEYGREVGRVIAFMDSEGQSLIRSLGAERAQASEALDFEEAARVHRRLEKVQEVVRQRPGLAQNLAELHAVMVERGADPKSVVFFRINSAEIRGPVTLSLDEKVSSPVPLDEQIRKLLDSIGPATAPPADPKMKPAPDSASRAFAVPPWEHLSLLARWYYSSFREGELIMLPPSQEIPHARLIRICRKILAADQGEGAKPRAQSKRSG
jgi:excinuclease ABC subunit C